MHFSKIAVASTAVAAVKAGAHAAGTSHSSSVFFNNSTEPVATWTTETVTAYVTYCPSSTSFVRGTKTYIATASEWVTVTDCPKLCTISYQPIASPTIIPAGPTTAKYNNGTTAAAPTTAYGTGVYHAPASNIVVAPSNCPCATKSMAPGITYNGPAGTGKPGVPASSAVDCLCATSKPSAGSPPASIYLAGPYVPSSNTTVPNTGAVGFNKGNNNNNNNNGANSNVPSTTDSGKDAATTGANKGSSTSSTSKPSHIPTSGAVKLARPAAIVAAVGAAVFYFC